MPASYCLLTNFFVTMLSTSKEIWKFVFQYIYRLFHVLQYSDNRIPFNDIRFSPLQRPLIIYFSIIKITEKDREDEMW